MGGSIVDTSELTGKVIGCAMRVHSALGPGLLESAYRHCLVHELKLLGLEVQAEVKMPIAYQGLQLDAGYRLDILVENVLVLVLETQGRGGDHPVPKAQLISYLKLGGFPAGLLINFNVVHLRDGITRLYPRAKAQP